jgi:hypothetical protein
VKLTKDGQPDTYVHMYTEVYGINNDGAILNVNTFTSSSENPFLLFKQVAGEHITFVRNLDGTNFFHRGNLDLVIIPDVIVSAALQLAGGVENFDEGSSSDNNDSSH